MERLTKESSRRQTIKTSKVENLDEIRKKIKFKKIEEHMGNAGHHEKINICIIVIDKGEENVPII